MRFDLKVPFAEKDAAKKLGARWDGAAKVWYILDINDIASFSKWSPTPNESSTTLIPQKATPAKAEASGKVYVGCDYIAHPRVCECLPWEVCDKCRATALST